MVERLCSRSDVVCLQECRDAPDDTRILPGSRVCFSSMFPPPPGGAFNSGHGGVFIGVRRTLMATLADLRHEVVESGRASCVLLQAPGGGRRKVVTVHVDPGLSAEAQGDVLRRLHRASVDAEATRVIMLRDWNLIGDDDSKMRDGLDGSQGGDALARVLDVLFEAFAKIWQPLPTFGRR